VRLPPFSHSRWWCTKCWKGSDTGSLITQKSSPPVSGTVLMEEAVRLKLQNLARGLDANQRDALFHQLEALEGGFRFDFASAWQSCDTELQAIRRTRESEKRHAFHRWLKAWLRELIKLQREIIKVVRGWPDRYAVPQSKREEWIDEVSEVSWIRLGGRQYGSWIIAAAFEPESETAPAWLCSDTPEPVWEEGMLPLTPPPRNQKSTEETIDHLGGDIDRQLRRARHATDRTLIAPDIEAALRDVSRLASLAEARYAEQPPVETRRSRRSSMRHEPDPRKQRIALIKAQHPRGIPARDVCKEMDTIFERVGLGQKQQLQPLESWMTKAGKRRWTDLFDDSRTNKAVGKYIYKIPRFRTSNEPVSR
jgi:hypothetical protein